MNPSDSLARNLTDRKDELVTALGSSGFYAELLLIAAALALSWLLGMLVARRVRAHLEKHPPRRIDSDILTKPLSLLPPLLALVYLAIARPYAAQFGDGGHWVDATFALTVAYLLARGIMLVVDSRPVAYFIAVVILGITALDVTGVLEPAMAYLDSIAFHAGQFHVSVLNLAHGFVILVIVFWIAGLLSRTLESYLRRSSRLSYNARELTVKFFRIFVYFIALLITLSAIGVDLTAFAVFGGALGVGVGLGLQKITSNFVSGITLLMEKSVQIGDLVEISDISGWVRQLNIRYTLIETFDGREVLIPNEELVSTRVINWTHSNTRGRIEIKVGVAYGSDPKRVREIMLEAAKSHPLCLKDQQIACHLREFGDSSLNFLLTFWIPDVREGRFGPQSEVMITILQKFQEAGISIPFPQREVRMLDSKTN